MLCSYYKYKNIIMLYYVTVKVQQSQRFPGIRLQAETRSCQYISSRPNYTGLQIQYRKTIKNHLS